MSETHIGVWKAPHAANVWYWQHPGCAWNAESTLAAAADAGRAHLAEHHAQAITPIVQTVVLSTRCTCGDLPRNAYPYFSPCPVHSYLVNTFTTTNAPTQGYCRLHGVHKSVCGCRVASVDPDALGGREKPAQRCEAAELQNQINCAVDRMNAAMNGVIVAPLVDVDRAFAACDRPDCPICATRNPLQTAHNESREGC